MSSLGDQPIDLGRSLTAERVAAHLLERITLGELRSGTSLREVELAAAFDVSRNTIREAFRVLERDRLIVHQAHRGVMVRTLRPEELDDLYRFRALLELEGLRRAAPDRLAPLEAALAAATAVAKRGDARGTLSEDLRFHQAIVDLADSARMSGAFAGLLAELRLGLSSMEAQASRRWLRENRRILALLRDGDRKRARRALREYLRDSQCELHEHLAAVHLAS
jgi:DNA-binding GntR family transcriptional regulator